MFLCEILTEQRQAPPMKTPAQNVHVHVHQPASPKEKKEPKQPAPVQQEMQPQEAAPVQQMDPNADYGDEYDPEMDGGEVPVQDPFQEILPIKRYYLVQRLKELKTQLDDSNIKNEDFDIVIKFINNLSYNSLVMLSNGIIPVVEEQIARLTANVQ